MAEVTEERLGWLPVIGEHHEVGRARLRFVLVRRPHGAPRGKAAVVCLCPRRPAADDGVADDNFAALDREPLAVARKRQQGARPGAFVDEAPVSAAALPRPTRWWRGR